MSISTEPPSSPGKPTASDWGSDFVELTWPAPKEDGGSPISSYIIQKRVRGSNIWEKGAEVPGTDTKGKVPHLIEGQEYEFRVIAVNKGGESKPSEASDFITAKPRFCKLIFYSNSFHYRGGLIHTSVFIFKRISQFYI